jgi:multidrug efflux pump subunit AcrB
MKRIIAAFARNTVFANIILVLIFMAGGIATMSMIRENFPEFSLDMITISVAYPGADPEEVEEGISRKIEEALEGLEGIKQFTTHSSENVGTTIIEVKEDYDINEIIESVRNKVNAISSFPIDTEKPIITELMLKDPVMLIYFSARMSERRIKEWSQKIKDEIQLLPDVSKVDIFGAREYEIGIEISEERLREYGLTFNMVVDAIRRSSLNLSGGTIRTQGEEIRIRTMGRKYTGEALSSIVVLAKPEGEIITLDRVAHINDGFKEDPATAGINGKPSILFTVYKTPQEDALVISKAVRRYISQKQKQLPAGSNIKLLSDNTDMLRSRIDLLVRNGIIGLIIVLMLLWTFLNTRLSFWGGMGIPISIAGAMTILWAIGGTINMVSLFGLIMVLGIIVDDAIVVGEAVYFHRNQGKPPIKAVIDGVSEVGMPVMAAVATTIVAFIPLHAGYYGEEAVRLQRGKDDIRIKVRYPTDERSRISDLKKVRIRTRNGYQVPLMSVATISFEPGYATITRTDGMRRVAVSADVDTNKANANEIFAELALNFFPHLKRKHPEIHVAFQGEQKKMRESLSSLFVGYPLAILGMFIIVAAMFRSYAQPFIILFTVPFGIIGAVLGHLLLGYDLSIMSVFGMVVLTGVVVNDAIVLIEQINNNIAAGMPFFDAIIGGSARRFRALFITSISTVGGLAPLIMETDLQAKGLIPMALSIAAGIAFATVLTLILVPSLLVILSDLRLLAHRLGYGFWPKRLDVEPARIRHEDLLVDNVLKTRPI